MIRKMNSTATRLWQFRFVWRGYADGRNRVAVGNVSWTMPQGSAFRATLGFGTESRWDSRTLKVSPNLDEFVSVRVVAQT